MEGGFWGVVGSRKAWAVAVGSMATGVVELLGFLAQVRSWTPQELQAWTIAVHCTALALFVAGMFVSYLWHRESFARDYGVTEITPQELALKGQVIADLSTKLSPEAMKLFLELTKKAQTAMPDPTVPMAD